MFLRRLFCAHRLLQPIVKLPPRITVSNKIHPLIERTHKRECSICLEDRFRFTSLPCCRKKICIQCWKKWFYKYSIECPYCRRDIIKIMCEPPL